MNRTSKLFFSTIFIFLGLVVIAAHIHDKIPHLSIPGVIILVLGMICFALSARLKHS